MSFMEIFTVVTSMLAGLALFLTGMNTLSDSLTAMTGGAVFLCHYRSLGRTGELRDQVHELFRDKYEVLKNSLGSEND